jgi:CDP-glycerol glycerophosphotransferase
VIVPAYNVERYLDECLRSILDQTFADFEIVVVDDGSTDSTRAVAREFLARDSRVRLVVSGNSGLGAARNLGIRHARGELLTFVDSDDTVPTDAFQTLVEALDESGSDFVVGSLARLSSDGEVRHPPWLRSLHSQRRLGITAQDRPEMLADVFVCNKVFRRDFWRRAALAFPEGIRYEDQVLTTQAYLRARSFDVVRKPVYYWRVRDDASSITQRRHELSDLRDRITTKHDALRTVQELGSREIQEVFFDLVLPMDLPTYFVEIPDCEDAYWVELVAGLRGLWEGAPPLWRARMPLWYRLVAWLVLEDRRGDAEAVVRFIDNQEPPDMPVVVRDGRLVVALPFLDDPDSGIPRELFQFDERELQWNCHLLRVDVGDDGLELTGTVMPHRVPQQDACVRIAVDACSESAGRRPFDVRRRSEESGGFTARLSVLDVSAMLAAADPDAASFATVEVSLEVAGRRFSGGFTHRPPGADDTDHQLQLPSGDTVALAFVPEEGLLLRRVAGMAESVPWFHP